MFKGKGEGEGTVSGFAAACTAMANTIGVGNIGGVATAITMGGPGAIFWMWISALLGMSTKACEIILGQRYRVKYENSMDEYMCDRSFVMKNALGWKKGAFILAICCFVLGPWTCCVQTESVVNSLKRSIWDQTIICDHCIRNHLLLNDRRWIKENFFCYGTNRAIYGNVIYPWWNRNSFDEYQCSTRSRCTDLLRVRLHQWQESVDLLERQWKRRCVTESPEDYTQTMLEQDMESLHMQQGSQTPSSSVILGMGRSILRYDRCMFCYSIIIDLYKLIYWLSKRNQCTAYNGSI